MIQEGITIPWFWISCFCQWKDLFRDFLGLLSKKKAGCLRCPFPSQPDFEMEKGAKADSQSGVLETRGDTPMELNLERV